MATLANARIERLSPAATAAHVEALGALLHACVHDGASVGFVLPFERTASEAFWREKVLPRVSAGVQVLWGALVGECVVGSVQLGIDTPPNQPHRADVAKLLVHPEWRRRGLARALHRALEAEARRRGRSLLILDTRTGDAAEPLYAALGYATAGVIPGYCVDPREPRLDATTIMYKRL